MSLKVLFYSTLNFSSGSERAALRSLMILCSSGSETPSSGRLNLGGRSGPEYFSKDPTRIISVKSMLSSHSSSDSVQISREIERNRKFRRDPGPSPLPSVLSTPLGSALVSGDPTGVRTFDSLEIVNKRFEQSNRRNVS